MNKEIYNATMEELGGVANQGRRMTLGFLFENDYITFEQYEYLVLNYAIIAKPPSYFSTL